MIRVLDDCTRVLCNIIIYYDTVLYGFLFLLSHTLEPLTKDR
jgi:hypothetical protein